MNDDENNLSLNIRARILPVLEGSDQLIQQVQQLPQSISTRLQETLQSPAFTEGLNSTQIEKLKHLTSLTESYEFEKIQERQKEISDDLKIDLDRGKLTLAQQKKHLGRFARYGQSMEGLGEAVSSELNDPYYNFLSQEQKTILRASIAQGSQEAVTGISGINQKFEEINYANDYVRRVGAIEREQFQRHKNLEYDVEEGVYTKARGQRYLRGERESIRKLEDMQQEAKEKFGGTEFGERIFKTMGDDIDAAKQRMKDFADEIEKAGKGSGNLLENLKATGLLTLAGTAINAGMNYWLKGKQIEVAERTSFDFSSPMGMYSEQQQYELYKKTTERTRQAELTGGIGGAIIGGIGALALGATGIGIPAAIVGGYFAGSSLLSMFAEGENIEDVAGTKEQLKRRQQVYGQLNSMVASSSQYDILRARTRTRIGDDAIGSLELGYMPEEELGMRMQFSDALGKFDPQLYKEQTTFARAKGIDPSNIYGLNVTARMTGMNVGIEGLDKAKQIATATYGDNVSSQRIVDVLNDIKNLNEKLLQTNVDMDSRDALRISTIPNMIFGNDSPFGRLGEKGADTLGIIDRLGQGGSLAQEAWLFSAYGSKGPLDFIERQRRGTLDPENFADITTKLKIESGGDKRMGRYIAEGLLNYDKNIPANFIPGLVDFMIEGIEPTKENLDKKFIELQKKYGRSIGSYQSDAEGAVSQTEKFQTEQKTISNQIGDSFRSVINRMSTDWLTTWKDLSTSTNNRIVLENQLNEILGESVKRLKDFFLEGERTYRKREEEFEDWSKKEGLERNRFNRKGSDLESDEKTKESIQRHNDKYKMQNSPSFEDWKSPNKNYFQRNEQMENQPPQNNYRELVEAFREALRNTQDSSKEIIIRDKTENGISAEQFDRVSRDANSIFEGTVNLYANSRFG